MSKKLDELVQRKASLDKARARINQGIARATERRDWARSEYSKLKEQAEKEFGTSDRDELLKIYNQTVKKIGDDLSKAENDIDSAEAVLKEQGILNE